MTGIYKLAEQVIEICSVYEYVHEMCKTYNVDSIDGNPLLRISVSEKDIESERKRAIQEDLFENLPEKEYKDEYLESLAIYRKLAEIIPYYSCFLFHGSAIAVNGMGYLFTAKSGTGKSTHTRLWRELLGEKVVMVNDDKPLIYIKDKQAFVYGTPWDGKHHLSNNISAPLKAVCILERSEVNYIRTISKTEAIPMLLQQAYRPSDPLALKATLNLIDLMQVDYYHLGCNMEVSAARLAYETIK